VALADRTVRPSRPDGSSTYCSGSISPRARATADEQLFGREQLIRHLGAASVFPCCHSVDPGNAIAEIRCVRYPFATNETQPQESPGMKRQFLRNRRQVRSRRILHPSGPSFASRERVIGRLHAVLGQASPQAIKKSCKASSSFSARKWTLNCGTPAFGSSTRLSELPKNGENTVSTFIHCAFNKSNAIEIGRSGT